MGANNLFDAQWEGTARSGADESKAEESDAGNDALEETREEVVKAVGGLAGFGDDGFIASENVDIVRVKVMVAKEQPEYLRPGEEGGEEALNGAVAGAVSTPPSQAEHGNATGDGEHGKNDVEEVAEGGRGENRLEAGKQC